MAWNEATDRLLFEANPLPLCVFDRITLRYLDCNAAASNLYGYSVDELRALRVSDIRCTPRGERVPLEDVQAQMNEAPQQRRRVKHRLKTGRLVDVDVSLTQVRFEGASAWLAVVQDVTELVQSQEALLASEKRLRLSEQRYRLASAHGFVWDWDPTTGQLQVNADIWHRLGVEPPAPDQVLGLLEQLMHPDDRPRWLSTITAHVKFRTPYAVQFRLCDAQGQWHWMETTGQALWNLEGRVTYMAGTATDISARKRAENALMTYQLELSDLTQQLMQQERVTAFRVAQSLHDRLGQTLAVARLHLDATRADAASGGEPSQDPPTLSSLPGLIDSAVREVRQALSDLRPPPLHGQGLVEALENEALALSSAATGVDVLLESSDEVARLRWPSDVEYAVFKVAREAIDQAVGPAQARLVRLVLEGDADRIALDVVDDGAPLPLADSQTPQGAVGRVSMRERAFSIDARLHFSHEPQGGNRARLTWQRPP